jgi:hypothetical protein
MHEVLALTEVKIRGLELLKRPVERARHIAVVGVVELRREEDLLAGDTRRLDTLTDLALVTVRGRGIDVSVPRLQRDFDSLLNEARLGLPGACASLESAPYKHRERHTSNDSPKPSVGMRAPVFSFTVWETGIVDASTTVESEC